MNKLLFLHDLGTGDVRLSVRLSVRLHFDKLSDRAHAEVAHAEVAHVEAWESFEL